MICTKCGAVIPDMQKHTCKSEMIPQPGKEYFGLVVVDVEENLK
jgi:hypothetical protein